jgi:phage terminase large subunit-like protein
MKSFLSEYLEEIDMPQRVDGQLDAILSDKEVNLVSGGNQSGKSAEEVVDGTIDTVGELPTALEPYRKQLEPRIERAKAKYTRGRVVAVDFKQLQNTVIPTWRQWFPRGWLKKGSWDESFMASQNLLRVYNKNKEIGQIEYMTNQMDIDSFQGPPLDWLKYDEEPKQAIYKENLMRFVTSDRLNISIHYTPTHGLSWTTDMVDSKNVGYFQLCTVSNPKANLDAVRSIISDQCQSYDEIKMRLLGEFISLSGLIYGNLFDRKIHVVRPFEITKKDYVVYRGLDPHQSKPAFCVELAVDREENRAVIGTYVSRRGSDTEIIKADLAERAKAYRLGRTICDRSIDYDIKLAGGINPYRRLKTGTNAIPALCKSEKYSGSIFAGTDEIKKALKVRESGFPQLVVFDIPENHFIIKAFKTLEREQFANEDKKGEKDAISEGKHDAHACLRYIHQLPLNWIPPEPNLPEVPAEESYV